MVKYLIRRFGVKCQRMRKPQGNPLNKRNPTQRELEEYLLEGASI